MPPPGSMLASGWTLAGAAKRRPYFGLQACTQEQFLPSCAGENWAGLGVGGQETG